MVEGEDMGLKVENSKHSIKLNSFPILFEINYNGYRSIFIMPENL